jgi:hypothetical protein
MRQTAIMLASFVMLLALTATGQESRSEISVQGTGLFTQDTSGQGVSRSTTDTGGQKIAKFEFPAVGRLMFAIALAGP